MGLTILVFSVSPASAAEPWWHLTSTTRPSVVSSNPETKSEVVVTAINLGNAPAAGETAPIRIEDTLPTGLRKTSISAAAESSIAHPSPLECHLGKPGESPYCEFKDSVAAYGLIEMRVSFLPPEEGPPPTSPNRVSITGGGAPPAELSRSLAFGPQAIPFGLADYELNAEEEGGAPDTTAGSHPFQLTTTLVVNQKAAGPSHANSYEAYPVTPVKNIQVALPRGLVGNPTLIPVCTISQFFAEPDLSNAPSQSGGDHCPAQTVVGVAAITIDEPILNGITNWRVPIFNLQTAYGEPARFGFALPDTPIYINASLRDGEGETGEPDYGITAGSLNTSETASFIAASVTFWGTPGAAAHDTTRGRTCLGTQLCAPLGEEHPDSFLTMPTSCSGSAIPSVVEVDSWAEPSDTFPVSAAESLPALERCNQVPFAPMVQAEPTSDSAASPSGLNFNVYFNNEGLSNAKGLAESDLNKVVVTLPEGFTIDPSAGVGLVGCTPADYARETVESAPGAGCPNESKLGTVEIETPLLTQKIKGSIFIAQPYENPFPEPEAGHPGGTLVALYLVAKNPETGVLVKLAGKVTPNPLTGQLVTTFENNPQVAFDHFNFHFREGAQAPLITPATCGTYTVQAALSPWSEPATALIDTSSFEITSGVGGGACPAGGAPPFNPGIESGTVNNNGGAFSSFYLHLSRGDADQEISGFSTDLPPGLTGDLTGVPFCPEADIEAARHKTGAEEEADPSCPAASQIGRTLVGTGVGAVLAYVPGKIYLAGPFEGAPFSIVSITSAKVGPFDLGTVVLRFGLNIDPHTAQVSVDPSSSEPIPTIIDGIVTHVRDIRVYIDRPNFILNPTSCNPLSISSTLTAHEGASATVSSPFQAASCGDLTFTPKFAVSTSGRTSRANGTSLSVKLTYPLGAVGSYANIAKVKVELPKQLPSRLTTLQKACKAAQFEADPAGCPAASIVGRAKALTPLIPVPLEGPAYFVSHGGEAFPSLVIVLQGYGITIDLVGSTFINKAGITSSTFKAIPDQPVGSFELTLPKGPYSALAANGSLCKQKLAMPTEFVAQNGAVLEQSTKIKVEGCPKTKTKKTKKKTKHHSRKSPNRDRRK